LFAEQLGTKNGEESLGFVVKLGGEGMSLKKASTLLDAASVNEKPLGAILGMDAKLGEKLRPVYPRCASRIAHVENCCAVMPTT
jgi:hypothetical protein